MKIRATFVIAVVGVDKLVCSLDIYYMETKSGVDILKIGNIQHSVEMLYIL